MSRPITVLAGSSGNATIKGLGSGSYAMTLSHYEPVPGSVQAQVVAQYAKDKQQEEE